MAKKMKNRTVAPDGQAIQRLRIEKGWRHEDLARKVGCSLKTVENVEHGENVYLFTIQNFAQALGVEVTTLLKGASPPPPPRASQRTWEITFKVSTPYEEFDQSTDLTKLFSTLIERLGGVVVEPEEVRKGNPNIAIPDTSHPRAAEFLNELHQRFGYEQLTTDPEGTRIHFFATGFQIRRVLEAYKEGHLDDLGITRIWVLYSRVYSRSRCTMFRFGGNRPFWTRYFPTMAKRVRRFLGDDGPKDSDPADTPVS